MCVCGCGGGGSIILVACMIYTFAEVLVKVDRQNILDVYKCQDIVLQFPTQFS